MVAEFAGIDLIRSVFQLNGSVVQSIKFTGYGILASSSSFEVELKWLCFYAVFRGDIMTRYTIEVSETIYNLLNQQAAAHDSTLEKVIERLLIDTPSLLQEERGAHGSMSPESVNEALAAVQRLTTLFADVKITNLNEILDDPLLELANVDLDTNLI